MRAKTKVILLLMAVLGVEATYLGGQASRIIQVDKQHSVLAKNNQELHNTITRLQSKVKAEQERELAARASNNPPENSEIYIPVPVDTLKDLGFSFVDPKFILSNETVSLLNLSDDEAGQVQKILLAFKDKIHAYQKAVVQPITLDRIPNARNLSFQRASPESIKYYEIPPISESDLADMRNWLSNQLSNSLGKVRADILLAKAEKLNHFWLQNGTLEYLAYANATKGTAIRPGDTIQWRTLLLNGHGMQGGGGSSKDLASSDWGYLFDDANNPTSTTNNSPTL